MADQLGDGSSSKVWRSLGNGLVRVDISPTGLQTVRWAGGSIGLPSIGAIFRNRPNEHSPYQAAGWDELKWGQSATATSQVFHLVGWYEGVAIESVTEVMSNAVSHTLDITMILPSPSLRTLTVGGSINRLKKSQSLPFKARAAGGCEAAGDLNARFSAVPEMRCLEVAVPTQRLIAEWDCSGVNLDPSRKDPREIKAEVCPVAAIGCRWIKASLGRHYLWRQTIKIEPRQP